MFTDSHCHLASNRYDSSEIPSLIGRAKAAGVSRMITLATCLGDLDANLRIALHPAIHACIGIHPCDVHHAPDDATERLSNHCSNPRVCAIGETGLDYYHPAPDGWNAAQFRARQQCFLRQHFELAARAGLNIVIHTRDRQGFQSFEDAIAVYRDHCRQVRAVFHCFAGSWEQAQKVIGLGGLLSFGGVTTFKSANDIRACIRQCPAGTFMLETDSPYLAPVPHRGQRNEPAFMRHIAEAIATLRGEATEALAAHTEETADAFFRFQPEKNTIHPSCNDV